MYRNTLVEGERFIRVTLKNDEFDETAVITFKSIEEVDKFINGEYATNYLGEKVFYNTESYVTNIAETIDYSIEVKNDKNNQEEEC